MFYSANMNNTNIESGDTPSQDLSDFDALIDRLVGDDVPEEIPETPKFVADDFEAIAKRAKELNSRFI